MKSAAGNMTVNNSRTSSRVFWRWRLGVLTISGKSANAFSSVNLHTKCTYISRGKPHLASARVPISMYRYACVCHVTLETLHVARGACVSRACKHTQTGSGHLLSSSCASVSRRSCSFIRIIPCTRARRQKISVCLVSVNHAAILHAPQGSLPGALAARPALGADASARLPCASTDSSALSRIPV